MAITVDSTNSWGYQIRAWSLYNLRQYNLAIEATNKAIALAPNYFYGYQIRGDCYKAMNNEVMAKSDYDKVASYKK